MKISKVRFPKLKFTSEHYQVYIKSQCLRKEMPAQQLERGREKVAVMKMGGSLPANSSSAALVSAKTAEGTGLLQPEFRPASHAASGHITTRQWITVAVLVYVNLINYMDRLTLAGKSFVSAELI